MDLTRRRFLGGFAMGCLGGLSACAVNPSTGRSAFTAFMSPQEEMEVGRDEHPKLLKTFGGEYSDPAMNRYIADIGRQVASASEMSGLPYTFTVLNSPIVNAMALPGGHIYITRGLIALANNEAELAGVLAHEVGHVNARHTAERYSQAMLANIGLTALGIAGSMAGIGAVADVAQFGASAYLQGFSRDQELEADTLGVRYMTKAGYDNAAMVKFLGTLRRHDIVNAHMNGQPDSTVDEFNMMATHPRAADRVERAVQTVQAVAVHNPKVGRAEYLAKVGGLIFGDDPSHGIVKESRFAHPSLRFEFTVPPGFRIVNSETQVVAKHSGGSSIMFDIGQTKRASSPMVQYLQSEWATKTKLGSVEAIDVNGMEAATGAARATVSGNTVDIRLVAVRRSPDKVYRFIFITPVAETERLANDLRRTTYSLRTLTPAEAAKVSPLRVVVVPVRPNDTPRAMASGLPFGEFNEEWFRLLNDLRPGELPPPGADVKIIAG